jgi:hypothetical protein
MYLSAALLALVAATSTSLLPEPQHIFSNPPDNISSTYRIPTVHESAVQARRILHLSKIGTLSTVFPSSSHSSPHAEENRPSSVSGSPIGLMDYFGDCTPSFHPGDPTILAISIATSFKNVASGSNITLSLRWVPPNPPSRPYSAAALPRFSLVGYLEDLSDAELEEDGVLPCFLSKHGDARAWLPGNRIHESRWVRLVVREIYWIGGFGDRAYIGWIPVEEWQGVTKLEIEKIRLPGENGHWTSGWRSWLGLGEQTSENWEL